jgi:hypothetical protein
MDNSLSSDRPTRKPSAGVNSPQDSPLHPFATTRPRRHSPSSCPGRRAAGPVDLISATPADVSPGHTLRSPVREAQTSGAAAGACPATITGSGGSASGCGSCAYAESAHRTIAAARSALASGPMFISPICGIAVWRTMQFRYPGPVLLRVCSAPSPRSSVAPHAAEGTSSWYGRASLCLSHSREPLRRCRQVRPEREPAFAEEVPILHGGPPHRQVRLGVRGS